MKELGKYLRRKSDEICSPFFIIQEQGTKAEKAQKLFLSRDIIEDMISYGRFNLVRVKISLRNKLASTEISLWLDRNECFPISGFPKALFQEDKQTSYKLHILMLLFRPDVII